MNTHPGIDSKNLAIGVLTITAVVMLAALVVLDSQPSSARADGMTESSGDYVVTVGGVGATDEDYVYILDVPMERLIAYRFNPTTKKIEIAQGIELSEVREAATRNDANRPAPKRPMGRRGRP